MINENSPAIGEEFDGIPEPISGKMPCPFCRCGVISGIKMLRLSIDNLERAVAVRKQCAKASVETASSSPTTTTTGKRNREEEAEEAVFRQIEAESSFLLLSHTTGAGGGGATDHRCHRTGRWSSEEVAFVDFIVGAFDQGALPIPHGVKLNDFLGEILLCKSSRLTKKMKNAKLSTRSYTFKCPIRVMDRVCCATLSSLQEHFLGSITSEPSQLELRFNMTKLWRTHFSNLCLQVGYELLDAHDWVASLEEMEHKASQAEDHIRKARRRRMSLALRTDVGETANPGVFIGGFSARDANMPPPPPPPLPQAPSQARPPTMSALPMVTASVENTEMERKPSNVSFSEEGGDNDDADFFAALEMTAVGGGSFRSRLTSADMDFGLVLDDLIDPSYVIPNLNDSPQAPGDCGPFLEEVVAYMESNNVPFQHVDVWVPSFMGDDGNATSGCSDPSKLRLFPAGHATRSDLDATLRSQLDEYGLYSTNFSFAPGHGLPGRVYTSGVASWETRIDAADPHVFERAGGATVYGVKTAVGIPLVAEGIGTIVAAMYSIYDLEEDKLMLHKFVEDFKAWNPKPKWKLVIDLGSADSKPIKQVVLPAAPCPMVHFEHPKPAQAPNLNPVSVVSAKSLTPTGSRSLSTTMPVYATPSDATLSMTTTVYRPHAVKMEPAKTKSPNPTDCILKEEDEEERIASLLGDHMPTSGSPSATLVPHFMSLRLLLLRAKSHRAPQESENLDVIKRSFRGYSKDNRRSGSELAALLAKDWMYLQQPNSGMSESPMTDKPLALQYQNHAMTSTTLGMMPLVPQLTYSLPPPTMHSASTRMVVHEHGSDASKRFHLYQDEQRSRSISSSSDSSANVVPEH